ncbi:pentapeptide repeat-containing protein [Amycolatopsis tucumanensis]|uniref:Pentapeptide repeat-containing protein n=1 Tax=Amycolatopsis tucumanensis TaxID=401106 RepID=A0ABP7HWC5_9PSEU|nr:pentapeptide repeat-containing protein [Amycolatopsis tucumanensis]MCF6426933.1 pentapeptide repeat-containing protein [Amycolatopsis tucumanensis]
MKLRGDETDEPEARREEVVRVAAQRLIRDLLPKRADAAPTFDLDLSGAKTNRLDLSGRVIGRLLMQRAQLLHRTDFSGTEFRGRVYFTGAEPRGPVTFASAVFRERAGFDGMRSANEVDFTHAEFRRGATVDRAEFAGATALRQ